MVSEITGVPRPGRSYYLDALVLQPRDVVMCVSDMTGNYQPGVFYATKTFTRGGHSVNWIQDSDGVYRIPGARFVRAVDDPCDDCGHWAGKL